MVDQGAQGCAADRNRTKVLIVGDHPIMREGIRLLLEQQEDLMVCGEAENLVDAQRAIEAQAHDVALLDLSLKESSGLELVRNLRQCKEELRILALSIREEPFYAERILRAGANGYVTKDDGTACLIEGIRTILTGQIYISDKMAARMIRIFVGGGGERGVPLIQNLTDRELEVFELIGQGLTTRLIAKKLHLSIKTIGSHREHIKDKLRLTNTTDLLRQAIQWAQLPSESA